MSKSLVDPSNLLTPWRHKQGILISLLMYFGRVDLKCVSLRKTPQILSLTPVRVEGVVRSCSVHTPGALGEQRLLCASAPHCTPMGGWAGFASSCDISGDKPASATMELQESQEWRSRSEQQSYCLNSEHSRSHLFALTSWASPSPSRTAEVGLACSLLNTFIF